MLVSKLMLLALYGPLVLPLVLRMGALKAGKDAGN